MQDLHANQADTLTRRLRRSLVWLRHGRADLALPLLNDMNASAPENTLVQLALGTALLRTGETERALATFDGLLSTFPSHTRALQGRGLCLHAAGDIPGALDAFRRAVCEDPLAYKVWGSIADISQDEAERVNAVQGVADSLVSQLGGPGEQQTLFMPCIRALIDARRPEEAALLLRNRLESSPGMSRHLAQVLYEMGNFPEALAYARKAFLLDPQTARPSTPKFSPSAAIEALTSIVAILEAAGARPFLVAGTLLGMYRSGAPLPHDRDVDIGLMQSADGPDTCAVLRTHPNILLPRRSRPGDRYFQVWIGGVGIDIFLHDTRDGALLCGLGAIPGDIQWRFSAFEPVTRSLGGRDWRVPDQTERYLAESYGENWQLPDPHFASVIGSPSLYGIDPHVRGCYAIWRAEKALRANDPGKAAALLAKSPMTCDLAVPQSPAPPPETPSLDE